MRLILASLAMLILFATGLAHAERPYMPLEQRFSYEQFRAAGLDRLTEEQLAMLNQLLRNEQVAVVEAAKERTRRKVEAETTFTGSLKGNFQGWRNGQVLELDNGQRWQVVGDEYYLAKPIPSPNVTVKRGPMGSWYLQIEGMNAGSKVKRIEP